MFRLIVFLCLAAACLLSSCVSTITTRTEEDVYTITKVDTTTKDVARNQPGTTRDGGVIYPSSRTVETKRTLVQSDSTVERQYPDFIRLGLFESIGLIGSASSGKGIGTGIFGIYFDPLDFLSDKIEGKSDKIFGGGIYRFGIYEYRLRWFRDAANWTIGSSGIELIYPEASNEKTLMSVLPLYIRKRYYLREDIPYFCFTITTGLGFYPSQYVNISGSADLGSIGGLNMRAYVGLVAGANASNTALNQTQQSVTTTFPYFGLGISVLDFHNRVPELYKEWKDHEHSSWEVGLLQVTLLRTAFDSSALGKGSFPFQGYQMRVAPASIALPWLNHQLYAGTSLFNLIVGGSEKKTIGSGGKQVDNIGIGFGILPIRVGYWQPVLLDELSVEPFIEYSYYPSSIFQIGAKANLFLSKSFNLGLNLGYINSGGLDTSNNFFERNFGQSIGSFSSVYFGITIGIEDRIFFGNELRYNRATTN